MQLPRFGQIITFDLAECVGRIRTDDGLELRFSKSGMQGEVTPVAGMTVRVHAVAPHPLGGLKATSVEHVLGSDEEEAALAAKRAELVRIGQAEQRVRDAPFELEHLKRVEEAQAMEALRRRMLESQAQAAREEAARVIAGQTGLTAWRALLTHVRLTSRSIEALLAEARPAARLGAISGRTTVSVGSSKLAGAPDVPPNFEWPEHAGLPLDFIAQIALGAAPVEVRRSLRLPDQGVLSFFYAARTQPWGIDEADRGSSRTYYFADPSTLIRRTAPAELISHGAPPEEIAVKLVLDVQLPPLSSDAATVGLDVSESGADEHEGPMLTPQLAAIRLGNNGLAKYARAVAAYESVNEGFAHVLGGYAVPVQGAMEAQCAALDHTSVATEWVPLLQLDSGADVGEWGDDGRLYFWVRERDLRARDFSRVLCILQSH